VWNIGARVALRKTRVSTIADAALDYTRRGWKPVAIRRGTKKPIDKGWQTRPFDPAQFNGNAQNVAIQLGEVSGGLVDVDLDTMLAVGLAPDFLPATDAIFGRQSKPCSHQLYITDLCATEKLAAIPYKEFVNGRAGQVLVELRIGGGTKGAATVFPPSLHTSGDVVQWLSDGEPARVPGNKLKRAVLKLAVACLLKPRYPGQGSRHEGALVLGGMLARSGWSADDIRHVVEVLARGVGDDDVPDRVMAATSAVNVKANGHDVAGLTRFGEVWGKDAADTLAKWLRRRDDVRSVNKDAGLEDTVALAFAEQHAEHFRYIAASKHWMRWGGSHWQVEQTLGAFDESRKLCRTAGDAKAKTVASVVTLARSDRRIAATADQWDRDPWSFNTGEDLERNL
jgi:Bifunctional DNA primase/polymerase, N-terminal/D5 N terminal like